MLKLLHRPRRETLTTHLSPRKEMGVMALVMLTDISVAQKSTFHMRCDRFLWPSSLTLSYGSIARDCCWLFKGEDCGRIFKLELLSHFQVFYMCSFVFYMENLASGQHFQMKQIFNLYICSERCDYWKGDENLNYCTCFLLLLFSVRLVQKSKICNLKLFMFSMLFRFLNLGVC